MATHKTKYLDFESTDEALANVDLAQGETVLFTAKEVMYIMYLNVGGNKVIRDITRGVTDFNETTGRGELFFNTLTQAEFDSIETKDPKTIYIILNG